MERKKTIKDEAGRDDEIRSDQQYIIHKHFSPKTRLQHRHKTEEIFCIDLLLIIANFRVCELGIHYQVH